MTAHDYSIRVSERAKHARLKLSAREGLTVIIPSGFTLYTVHDGKIDAGQFVRLDPPSVHP